MMQAAVGRIASPPHVCILLISCVVLTLEGLFAAAEERWKFEIFDRGRERDKVLTGVAEIGPFQIQLGTLLGSQWSRYISRFIRIKVYSPPQCADPADLCIHPGTRGQSSIAVFHHVHSPRRSPARALAFSRTLPKNTSNTSKSSGRSFSLVFMSAKGLPLAPLRKPLHRARPGLAVTNLASPNPCPKNHQFPCYVFTRPITRTLFRCAVSPLRLRCFDSFGSATGVSQKGPCILVAGKTHCSEGRLGTWVRAAWMDGFGRRVGSGDLETL